MATQPLRFTALADPAAPPSLSDHMGIPVDSVDLHLAQLVATNRPPPLRRFDQIAMRDVDLVRQAKLIAPYLAGKSVAFVGDHDGASLMLGLLATAKRITPPSRMLVADFDERLLERIRSLADRAGFGDRLETRLYNVFDPVPSDLLGRWDWYYVNPPYGASNGGTSGLLFITRGTELVGQSNGRGCIIIPDDPERPWTRVAMQATQAALAHHGWLVSEKVNALHRYHLDDDHYLSSATTLVEHALPDFGSPFPLTGVAVSPSTIPTFYGREVRPPFPRYVLADGGYEWWPGAPPSAPQPR